MKNNYAWLDWMRFFAALIVVLGHTREIMFVKYAALTTHSLPIAIFFILTRMGNEAVLIFFVLSGFLVGGKALERFHNDNFDMSSYAIDRVTRIFIPLIPAIILTVAIATIINHPINWLQVAGNIFAMQGIVTTELPDNVVLWTLSYEIWFYILVAGIALCIKKEWSGIFAVAIIAIIFTRLFPHYLLCWLIGAIAHLKLPKKISPTLIILGLGICAYGYIGRQVGRGSDSLDIAFLRAFVPSEEASRVIFSIGLAVFIRHIILFRSWSGFEKAGSVLAASSYTLYLTHFPVVQFFKYRLGYREVEIVDVHTLMHYGFLLFSCVIVSGIMYLLFERNTAFIRSKFKKLYL